MPTTDQQALFLTFRPAWRGAWIAEHPFIDQPEERAAIFVEREPDGTWSARCHPDGCYGFDNHDAPTARVAMAWACAGVIEQAAYMAEQEHEAALRWMRRLGDVATFMRLKPQPKEKTHATDC